MNIEIQSHLDEEPDSPMPGWLKSNLISLPGDYQAVLRSAVMQTVIFRGLLDAQIEIAIVNDSQIHQLNQRHLDHDWETDVISFPYSLDQQSVYGELIVSWETAVREAQQTGWPPLTELALYVVHGTLHLTGLDDLTAEQRMEMRQAEQQVLARLSLEMHQLYDLVAQEARR